MATTPPGLYMDEAMDGVNAQHVAQTGRFQAFYPEDNGREGLYIDILAIAFQYRLLPDTAPWSVRFPAAVAGLLTVLGVYLLLGELFAEGNTQSAAIGKPERVNRAWTAGSVITAYRHQLDLLATFFVATGFWHVNFSRIGFRAILAPFCLVWASYFLFKLFRASATLDVWLWGIGAGVVCGLGFYTYIAFRVAPLLFLLFVPWFGRTPGFAKRAFLFLITAVLVALPMALYCLRHPADFFGRVSQLSVFGSGKPIVALAKNAAKTAWMLNGRGDQNWRHNIAGSPELWWPVGILFLAGTVLCISYLFQRKNGERTSRSERRAIFFLLTWFVLGALPGVLSYQGIPHALRTILMIVPAMTLAAIGALALYRLLAAKLSPRWMGALTALFIVIVIAGAYTQYFITWAKNPNVRGFFNTDWVAVGKEINALPPATQKYVVIYAGGVTDYGLPATAAPVLYSTGSFVPDAAAQKVVKNIHYLLPGEVSQIPPGTPPGSIFEIR
ncbi:MAG: hypothetical protein WBL61_02865 [Bryobacteraceae bacterium]